MYRWLVYHYLGIEYKQLIPVVLSVGSIDLLSDRGVLYRKVEDGSG